MMQLVQFLVGLGWTWLVLVLGPWSFGFGLKVDVIFLQVRVLGPKLEIGIF